MKRRDFIYHTAITASAFSLVQALQACKPRSGAAKQRILVLVQLTGGNDGLNTLIPLNNYKNLVAARPNLYIPENKVLPLRGNTETALHPALNGIRDMFDNNLAAFVQGVGYQNQSYSHFRSSDIWLTGSKESEVWYTGWMGRYLETHFANYPTGFPNASNPHPPAIKVGDSGTFAFQGQQMDLSIVLSPSAAPQNSGTLEDLHPPESYAETQVQGIRNIFLQNDRYTAVLQNALKVPFQHTTIYPPKGNNPLADQLHTVAKFINSGLNTQVYMVELKGFDTHAEQVSASDTTKGAHAQLLHMLSEGITCFWEDINKMDKENEVAGMVFSEFGRRIISNSSYGTDHGAAQPILLFGANLSGTIIGQNPIIPDRSTVDDNVPMQYDFRQVYTSVLIDWLQASDTVAQDIFHEKFEPLNIFNNT